ASGTTDVTLPLPPPNTPRYYRAVAVGGGTTPDTQIRLQIAAQSATRMRITVQGPSGTTHTVESTTNLVAWSPIGTVTIPEGSTNISFVTSVPAGSRGGIFRSRSDDVVTPPVGNRPTLSASASAAGLQVSLAGGDANRTYVVQQAGASLASWSATTFTITTGGTGAGQVIVTPLPGNSGIFRVEAR
ncbi:MAG: hypothetical protein JNL97_14875, partial [Verrucomicrobiales bacterium]|nr:hypothetical protein [Verrucomicrobiales bacterium]